MKTREQIEIDSEFIKKALLESQPDIILGIKKGLQERMMQHITYSMESKIEEEVKNFVSTEIVPEIRKSLESHKTEIIEAATESAIIITKEMMSAIVIKAKSNLQGYRGAEILKKLVD